MYRDGFYFGEHGGMFGKALRKGKTGFTSGPGIGTKGAYQHVLTDPDTGEKTLGELEWYRSPIYDELARVPLLIHLPGGEGSRISAISWG